MLSQENHIHTWTRIFLKEFDITEKEEKNNSEVIYFRVLQKNLSHISFSRLLNLQKKLQDCFLKSIHAFTFIENVWSHIDREFFSPFSVVFILSWCAVFIFIIQPCVLENVFCISMTINLLTSSSNFYFQTKIIIFPEEHWGLKTDCKCSIKCTSLYDRITVRSLSVSMQV